MKALLLTTGLATTALAGNAVNQAVANPIPLVDRCNNAGELALTFDGGPGQSTGRLLDALRDLDARVTFHISAHHLNQPNIEAFALGMKNDGHVIGLSWNPPQRIADMADEEIIAALVEESTKLQRVLGLHPRFLRLPHNSVDQRVSDIVTGMGFIPTEYNFDPQDYNDKSAEVLSNRYKQEFEKLGGYTSRYITVHHDASAEDLSPAITAIIGVAREMGYRIVGLDKCLAENFVYKSDAAGQGPFLTAAGSEQGSTDSDVEDEVSPDINENDTDVDEDDDEDENASIPVVPIDSAGPSAFMNSVFTATIVAFAVLF